MKDLYYDHEYDYEPPPERDYASPDWQEATDYQYGVIAGNYEGKIYGDNND